MKYNLNKFIARLFKLPKINYVANVIKFYLQNKENITFEIVTLKSGTLLYRDDTCKHLTFQNEPHIPLAHFHLLQSVDTQSTYRLCKDIKVFKCDVNKQFSNYNYQIHYIVPTLLNNIDKKDLLNKDLILKTLNNNACDGTMEQSIFYTKQYEICLDKSLVQKCNIDNQA